MREAFKNWNPNEDTMQRVQDCIEIIDNYRSEGLRLTLRQLYYQLVSRDWIPNNERSYQNLSKVLSNARLAGLIDWDAIEDRGRQPRKHPDWDGVPDLVESALASYRLPRWEGQEHYAELWVEKEALSGVLQPMADRFHATLMVNKGYSSQSAMYEAAQRLITAYQDEPDRDGCIVLYLGDHDPSGQDMVRDIEERLRMFTRNEVPLDVVTIALRTNQVEEYELPPNPAKLSDARAKEYIKRHGHRNSWEVDALEPRVLQGLVERAFETLIDKDKTDAIVAKEDADKEKLREVVEREGWST